MIKFVNIIRKLKLPPDLNEKFFLNSIQHLQEKQSKYYLHEIDEKCDILIPPEKSEILGPISQKIEKASKLFGEIAINFTTNIYEIFFHLIRSIYPKTASLDAQQNHVEKSQYFNMKIQIYGF